MNYQFNSSILIILVIYVLSFYQINCDNKTISGSSSDSNNSSSTTLNPTIVGNEEMETQIKSGTAVKKAEPKLDDALKTFTSGSIERESPAPSNSRKRDGVKAPDNANITKLASSEPMVLTTEKTIVLNSTISTSEGVVDLTKSKVSALDKMSTTTKTSSTTEITTTTTTTTSKPKKPEKTLPSNELPGLPAKPEVTKSVQTSSNMTINNDVKINPSNATKVINKMEPILPPSLSVEEPPKVQYSMESLPVIKSKRDYIIPVVALIFAIPILLAIATIMFRRVKDYWETRHYRRMDFLIDEMYND